MTAKRHEKDDDGAVGPLATSAINWRLLLIRAALITAATLWVFSPALRGEWLWDDEELISHNVYILAPNGLLKIWTLPIALYDYYPLLSSVEWIEWRLWHEQTLGYHLVNLVLHLTSALLVWRLFDKLGLKLAWLGGLIFAIHPVQVESVAWMAELKNTLSLPPFLLAMCAYIDFDERGKWRDYLLALGLFVVAMLCKTTVVMFPVVILLYAWWKRGRIRAFDLKASAAFFAVSLVLGYVTYWFQHHNVIGSKEIVVGGWLSRIALAGTEMAAYLGHCICPVDLLPIYPKWTVNPPSIVQFMPWIVLAGVIFECWRNRATWGRHVLLGLGFFLINLAPFIGLTNAYYMSFSWVLDHVLYIPLIGLAGLLAAGMEALHQKSSRLNRLAVFYLAIYFAFLAFHGHWYAAKFAKPVDLWIYTLERNPSAWPAHVNLGNSLFKAGRIEEAMDHFREAIRIEPDASEAHNNLGNGYLKLGKNNEAIREYEIAVKLQPDYEQPRFAMGLAFARLGRAAESMEQYRIAVRLNPNNTEAHRNLGELLLQAGKADEAAEQFKAALHNDPHFSGYQNELEKQAPPANR